VYQAALLPVAELRHVESIALNPLVTELEKARPVTAVGVETLLPALNIPSVRMSPALGVMLTPLTYRDDELMFVDSN
jgi:hypothetical protein